ncbi:siderophore-interacting protein [Polymorphospora rubra]|uniref:siderophore-interacting protein n=1 Tax=Polymorphospora rubra TaxID=338584 RepID=UPI0033DD94C6
MTDLRTAPETVTPWRPFHTQTARLRRLSPSFLRATFTGTDLDRFADLGYDLRIKLVFPLAEHGFRTLPVGPDWYRRWRSLPADQRNPFRTYTVRAARCADREIDVDLVLHDGGPHGPAARWAATARPGDRIVIMGPDNAYGGDHGGREFLPAQANRPMLLAGDETAVPAICAIAERLPAGCRGEILLEVPLAEDVLDCAAPPGVTVTWLPRSGAPHGSRLVPAVEAAAERLFPTSRPAPVEVGDGDPEEILWDVPTGPSYVWLAGEAGVIRQLRRHLVSTRGMDRGSVAFMGYWRQGHADPS